MDSPTSALPTPPDTPPRKRSSIVRWLFAGLSVCVVGLIVIVAALPWIIAHSTIKGELSRRVNVFFAPGRVAFDDISVSWFGPSSVTKFALIDSEGRPVVSSPRASVNWSLFEILFSRPKVARVTLSDGDVEVIHLGNGKTNLVETLRPVLVPKPTHTVNIGITGGTLRFRESPKAAPLVGESANVSLGLAAYPEPITWDIELSQPGAREQAGSLAFKGKAERGENGPEDVGLDLAIKNWSAATGPVEKGKLNGSLRASRRQKRWDSAGTLTLDGLELAAQASHGLPNRLAHAQAEWKLAQRDATSWSVESLRLQTPFATLDAQGTAERPDGNAWNVGLDASLSGLELPDPRERGKRLQEPLKTAVKLVYDPQKDRVDLSNLDLGLPLVRVRGSGSVVELGSRRTFDFKGSLEPDWQMMQKVLAERIEPRAKIAGDSRDWKLSGSLASFDSEAISRDLHAEGGIEINLLDIYGMRLDKTTIAGRFEKGKLAIDPIHAKLNGGVLHLEPELLVDKTGHRFVKLGKTSYLNEAQVNEEVSHRFLSFVAPVLDQATRVSGTVSMELTEAIFQIGATKEEVKPRVEGDISFENVEFAPGPFADLIFDTLFRERRNLLVLNDPVSLTVMDGRVFQEGLTIPVGKLGRISMDGSIGFDRTLDLTASLTLTPEQNGVNVPVLGSIIQGTRFAFPIHGTIDQPKLDTKGLGDNFKDMGLGLLDRTLTSATGGVIGGVEALKNLFGGGPRRDRRPNDGEPANDNPAVPAPPTPSPDNRGQGVPPPPKPRIDEDPDADNSGDSARSKPPLGRLTPEERKARRQERKMERMRKRGQLP